MADVGGHEERASVLRSSEQRSTLSNGFFPVEAKSGRPVRAVDLHGRMNGVAAKQYRPVLAAREADLTRRMTGQRDDREVRRQLESVLDRLALSRLDDRQDAVGKRSVVVTACGQHFLGLPMLELAAPDQVARVRECWNPSPRLESCIPAHVVGVEMGAKHDVDVVRRHTRCRQAIHVSRGRPLVPFAATRPRLVLPDTGID